MLRVGLGSIGDSCRSVVKPFGPPKLLAGAVGDDGVNGVWAG